MLERLEIKNFALLRDTSFAPSKGLIVISGETGAGKSLLMDAIGSLTGRRMTKEVIATGSERARVDAIFRPPTNLYPKLQELLPDDDLEEIIVSREFKWDGRSLSRINGHLVTLAQLKELIDKFIGIHGQHEQQQIFDAHTHLTILDNYIGPELKPLLESWRTILTERRKIASEIKQIGISPRRREMRIDWLEYSIEEITTADLQADSEEIILKKLDSLSEDEELANNLNACCNLLYSEDGDPIMQLDRVQRQLQEVADYNSDIDNIRLEMQQIVDRLRDLRSSLSNISESINYDPQEISELDEKLQLIAELRKKYGPSLRDVLDNLELFRSERQELISSETLLQEKIHILKELDLQLAELALQIHNCRVEYGRELAEKIELAVSNLGMSAVEFKVDIKLPGPDEKIVNYDNGRDLVEFLISTNIGEPLKPLAKIASGGEASRLLLAIKSIIADAEGLEILIFDEIDTGISGEAAVKVAHMLKQLSQDRQVLCVSHMAQVAALADEHWLIHKEVLDGITSTHLSKLDREQRTLEVTRLLAVDEIEARKLAESMLNENVN